MDPRNIKPNPTEEFVDAIEEGKIVHVSEDYARREGLLILRKPKSNMLETVRKDQKKEPSLFDLFKKPLRTKNDIASSLVDNFSWIIAAQRKKHNLTRKKLAEAINEQEYNLKTIENGILPKDDFILIAKLEKYFNINLRKTPVYSLPSSEL